METKYVGNALVACNLDDRLITSVMVERPQRSRLGAQRLFHAGILSLTFHIVSYSAAIISLEIPANKFRTVNTMAHSSDPQLSIWERLDLLPGSLSIIGTVLYSAATGLFRGKTGARTYNMHIIHAAVRKMCVRLTPRQAQCVYPKYRPE